MQGGDQLGLSELIWRLFGTKSIWESPDPDRSLFGASIFWLKAETSGNKAAINPLFGALPGRKQNKMIKTVLPGQKEEETEYLHLHKQTSTNFLIFHFIILKAHLSFLNKPICSSHKRLFLPLPFPLLSEYISPYFWPFVETHFSINSHVHKWIKICLFSC